MLLIPIPRLIMQAIGILAAFAVFREWAVLAFVLLVLFILFRKKHHEKSHPPSSDIAGRL